jgi:hypothetical protein
VTATATERQRRSRAHRRGNHSLCDPLRCDGQAPAVPVTGRVTSVTPGGVTLGPRGQRLWEDLEPTTTDPGARLLLEEACRIADRLDRLDRALAGKGNEWLRFRRDEDGGTVIVYIDKALGEARQQQVALKQLLSELRQSRAPAKKSTAAPAGQPQSGGGGVADLTARLAARRTAG